MPQYTVLTMQRGPSFRVHAAGCKDIQKDARNSNGDPWTAEAANVAEFVKKEVESLDQSFGGPGASGYSDADYEILPCARKAG